MKHALMTFVVAGLVLAGCSAPKSKFVGAWDGQMDVQGQKASVTQTFNADKTFTGSFAMDIPQVGKMSANVSGTWESKSDTELTTTMKDVTVEAPAAIKELFAKQMEAEKGKASTAKVEWVSDNEMKVTGPNGQPMTFKRK
jgi:hypothetical protein